MQNLLLFSSQLLHKTFFKALIVYQVEGGLKNMGDAAKYVFRHHATMSIEVLRKAMKTLNQTGF